MCKKICADFPIAPINRKIQIKLIKEDSIPSMLIFLSKSVGIALNTSTKLTLPVYLNIKKIPIAKPKSPTLLTTNAFMAAELADGFLYQNPIKR